MNKAMNSINRPPVAESALTRRNRRLAKRLGYRIHKSRAGEHLNNRGQHQVIENYHNMVVLGADFDASDKDVSDFLLQHDGESEGFEAARKRAYGE